MGIDHFLRQLRDGELESESSEEEPEVEEEPQGKTSRLVSVGQQLPSLVQSTVYRALY